jgi:hypothetical protein
MSVSRYKVPYDPDVYGPLGENVEPRVQKPPQPGDEVAGPPVTDLVHEMRETQRQLHAMYLRLSRQWDLYRVTAAITTTATTAEVDLPRVQAGWEVEVELVTLSVGGASSAAVATYYRSGVHEGVLVGIDGSLIGASPSRQQHFFNPALRLRGNEFLAIVLSAIAAAPQPIYVNAFGQKREL